VYTFSWEDGETQKAKLISSKENKVVKFRWVDDDPQCYFEMEIIQDELTNDVGLLVTDFATTENMDERKMIWNTQIENLVSVLGA